MPLGNLNNTTPGAVGPGILDPGVVGVQELVARGNRFNGLTVLSVPTGLQLFFRFGNNPRIGPVTDGLSITFQDVPASDTDEGVFAEVDVAVPGGVVVGWVSFAPVTPVGNTGGAIAAQGTY